jgi:VWFA-related protein
MKRTLHGALALLLLTSLAAGQQADPDGETADLESDGVFVDSVDVNVVNVDVYVTDKDGHRITGLTRDDFELEVGRKPVAITNFYAVENGEAIIGGLEPVEPEPGELPERRIEPIRVPEDQRLHLVVYVDNLNLHPFTRNRALRQARDFLRTRMRTGDEVMLVTYERTLHTRVPFTLDPEIVATALYDIEEMSGHAVTGDSDRRDILEMIYEADSVHEVRGRATQYAESIYNDMSFTLDALKEIVESLAGLPGRKAILYVSDGIPMRAGEDIFHAVYDKFSQESSILLESHRYDLSRDYQTLTNTANANRVTFYTLEAAGLRTYSFIQASNRSAAGGPRVDQVHFSNIQNSLRFLAHETGGMAMLNTNNFAPMLDRMADDFGSYYSLGFSPASSVSGRYHDIKVTVKGRKGIEVRHRDGYRDKPISTRMTDGTLAALHYGYQNNVFDVELRFGEMIPHDRDQWVVPLQVMIPIGKLSFLPTEEMQRGRLRLFVGAKDSEGGLSPVQDIPVALDIPNDEIDRAREQLYQYEIKLIMRGGRQVVAVGVRDEIGAETGFVTRGVHIGA